MDNPLSNIHQTKEWGVFQSKSPLRDKYWIIEDGDDYALVFRQKLPFKKSWLYCPRGPVFDYTEPTRLAGLFHQIEEISKKENAVFFRFDPNISDMTEAASSYLKAISSAADSSGLKLKPAHAHYQPESTLILDLTLCEKELMDQMKPKGRYNIKIAQKHGVKIKSPGIHDADFDSAIESFYRLLSQTTGRDGFSGHPLKYYKDMLTTLDGNLPEPSARLYLAEYQGTPVAGMIVTWYKDTAIYYFGASGNEHRNVMASYLLQWQAISDAKAVGLKYYDFLGIAPENAKKHPWASVTDFKLKFGGRRVDYIPAQEIVFQPFWYAMIMASKYMAKLLRAFKKAI